MTGKEMAEQGIAALKEGDKSRAHDLLLQAVELDPTYAKAWYFLSQTQSSTSDKRASLEKVLELMPNNKPARAALDKLLPEDEEPIVFDEDELVTATQSPPVSHGFGTGIKPQIGGLQIPVAIPDAPDTVEPKTIWEEFVATFRKGIETLRRNPDSYYLEIEQATWWRFWQFVVVASVIGELISTISIMILEAQQTAFLNNIQFEVEQVQSPSMGSILLAPILLIPIRIIVLYIGLYASHRFITANRSGTGTFVKHSFAVMLPTVTAGLIGDIVGLIVSFAPLLSILAFVGLIVLWIYSMYIATQGIRIVHNVDPTTCYLTVGVLVAVQIVASIIFSPFILTSGLGVI